MRGDKLMLGADTGQPGLDMVDWAISHIGVPYALGDYTDKLPYEKIECSSFVTANRIQEIGPENNTKYAVAFITAAKYLQGYYYYDGRRIDLTEQADPCADPDIGIARGYLLHLTDIDDVENQHIAVIMEMAYDCQYHVPLWCFIVHARGNEAPYLGRVRFDNAAIEYSQDDWTFTCLRLLEE